MAETAERMRRKLEAAFSPTRLEIVDDYVVSISGADDSGPTFDADLLASYLAAFEERAAYATSHIGWGMNHRARWDTLPLYDKSQINGTEYRAFAGNVVYSTGANETAGRHTLGHFDLPMKGCTVSLDGTPVVVDGVLQGELA